MGAFQNDRITPEQVERWAVLRTEQGLTLAAIGLRAGYAPGVISKHLRGLERGGEQGPARNRGNTSYSAGGRRRRGRL
jgi:hypothetical protein